MNPHVRSALFWIAAATAVVALGLVIVTYGGGLPEGVLAKPVADHSSGAPRPEPSSPPPPVN